MQSTAGCQKAKPPSMLVTVIGVQRKFKSLNKQQTRKKGKKKRTNINHMYAGTFTSYEHSSWAKRC